MRFPVYVQYVQVACSCFLMLMGISLPARDFWVYLGTYTEGSSKGIYVSRLNADTGELSSPKLAVVTPDPSYLALAPDGKHLYSANEIAGNSGLVSAFAIQPASGQLEFLNQKDSGGSSPCHVSVDATGQTLLVANYGTGTIKSLPILGDGRLGDGGTSIHYQGRSVNPDRQTGPHAHYLGADPSNRFVLGCDLGTDKIMVYHLDGINAGLVPNHPVFSSVTPGSGPRHLVFGRDGKLVYVVDEMACTVTCFNWDNRKGQLFQRQTISALPEDQAVRPEYTAAEIILHPNGRLLYVSVRGLDSISVFAVAALTGKLALIQNVSSGGKAPRGLGIDPTGRWLLAGNQKTDNVVEFPIDPDSGKLQPPKLQLRIGSPVDFKFIPAN
jgi:6-phosphogluconolactonase